MNNCSVKVQRIQCKSPKNIQKVKSVQDGIKIVIWNLECVARFSIEDLLGIVASTIHKM